MAKSAKARRGKAIAVNKSQAIRDKFAELGDDSRPRDIIAALKSDGIVVSAALVTNVHTRCKRAPELSQISSPAVSRGAVSLDVLIEAKRLVRRAGSLAAARAALEALAKLM